MEPTMSDDSTDSNETIESRACRRPKKTRLQRKYVKSRLHRKKRKYAYGSRGIVMQDLSDPVSLATEHNNEANFLEEKSIRPDPEPVYGRIRCGANDPTGEPEPPEPEPQEPEPAGTAAEKHAARKQVREPQESPFGLPSVDELEELLASLEEYERDAMALPQLTLPFEDALDLGDIDDALEKLKNMFDIEPSSEEESIGEILLVLQNSEPPVVRSRWTDLFQTSYTYAQFQKTGKLTAPATVIPRFRKYNVDDFHFLTVLGKGSFGKVFLAELKNSDYYYAIKCLKKDVVLEDDDVDCTLIERKVLALGTKHPFLCHLFCTFQTDSHLFFVMEYLNGGDLMFHIQQSGRFPEARARFYAAEIVSGLKFLHRKGIVYRDLKLDNVLLDYDGHVRIADFGMCKLEIYLDKLADSFCGTPDYMAPEIIKGQKYNQAVDWWSFGVLVYEMLVGQSPFSGCDEDELFWSICNEIPWFPHYLSKEALRLLQSLLEKDASIRLGVLNTMDEESDIKYHPFFNSIIWDKLERRAVEPPFKPQVRHPLDTQYFDKQFTRERARLTPIDRNILASMDQAQFEGFTYTNPNNTLTKIREKQKKKQKKMYFCPQCGDIKVTYNIF
uniref:Non-specific serine/threonine protein kinase n=1 Tax=Anopheles minimus TaxID=112268 RepID=A0A182W5T9_9DIPT